MSEVGVSRGVSEDRVRRRECCFDCARRLWLLEQLSGHLDHHRGQIRDTLGHPDLDLIGVCAGTRRERLLSAYAAFTEMDADDRAAAAADRGLELTCRHQLSYPEQLWDLDASSPAALYVAGSLERLEKFAAAPMVAIVGTRRPSVAGSRLAHELGRGLAAAKVTVVSGMALGIDSAAHEGALDAGGATVAVLPGPADRAYPVSESALYARIREQGVVLSELTPAMDARRWGMVARNRIIAALAHLTVVVEANTRSGSLITLETAKSLGRGIAAVPGAPGAPLARGTNHAIAKREAALVRGPQDVLDLLFGDGAVALPKPRLPELTPEEAALMDRIHRGARNMTALDPELLALVTALELKGWISRGPGGVLNVLS